MNLNDLLDKLKNIEEGGCGTPMPMSMPPEPAKPEVPEPTMNVTINAQGMHNIEDILNLWNKMKDDAAAKMPMSMPASPMPSMSIEPMDKPSLPPLKMLPDFDADNDDMPGGEMDDMGPGGDEMNVKIDTEKGIMSKDDDEKKEAYANEPDEEDMDVDYVLNKVTGDMNRKQGTYAKVAGGDNPMQKITQEDRVESIKKELYNALSAIRGAK